MIYAKEERYGLDEKIYQMQLAFEEELPWISENNCETVAIYGKIHRNTRDDKIIPEAYKCNGEYGEVFIDDKIIATIGFLKTGNRDMSDNLERVQLDIICSVNLDSLYCNSLREDEKALSQFLTVVRDHCNIDSVNEVKEGIRDVFADFYIDNIIFNDMEPWYIFSVNVSVQYSDYDLCL